MRSENSIFEAVLPEPFIILGLRLKPFSLGHYMLLHRNNCSFVSGSSATATRDDLVFAVLACSMSFEEFDAWLCSKPLTRWEKFSECMRLVFGRSTAMAVGVAMQGDRVLFEVYQWGRKCGLFNLNEKVALFLRYLNQNSQVPKYWEENTDGAKVSGAHWAQSVFNTLTGTLGFTRTEALNMPLREALLHHFKSAENAGVVRLMTDDELDAIEPKEACGS